MEQVNQSDKITLQLGSAGHDGRPFFKACHALTNTPCLLNFRGQGNFYINEALTKLYLCNSKDNKPPLLTAACFGADNIKSWVDTKRNLLGIEGTISDCLLSILKAFSAPPSFEHAHIYELTGTYNNQKNALVFALDYDNILIKLHDGYKTFVKLNHDSEYYRIKLHAVPCINSLSNLYIRAQDACRVLQLEFNCIAYYGHIWPSYDLDSSFSADKGHYLFIKVPTIEQGLDIEQKLISWYEAILKDL